MATPSPSVPPTRPSAPAKPAPKWHRFSKEPKPTGFCGACGYPDEIHLTAIQRMKAEKGTLNFKSYVYRPGTDCFLRRKALKEYEASLEEYRQEEIPEPPAQAGDDEL